MARKQKNTRTTIKFTGAKYSKFLEQTQRKMPGLSTSKIIETLAAKGAEFYDNPQHEAIFKEDLFS